MWLGGPRRVGDSIARRLGRRGAAAHRLHVPADAGAPGPWEELSGRPATGLLATRGADVSLLVADALASLQLPAALAPAILSFAMQEVLDRAGRRTSTTGTGSARPRRALTRDHLTTTSRRRRRTGRSCRPALRPRRRADRFPAMLSVPQSGRRGPAGARGRRVPGRAGRRPRPHRVPVEDAYLAGRSASWPIWSLRRRRSRSRRSCSSPTAGRSAHSRSAPFQCEWDAGERVDRAPDPRGRRRSATAAGSSRTSGRGSRSSPKRSTSTSSSSPRSSPTQRPVRQRPEAGRLQDLRRRHGRRRSPTSRPRTSRSSWSRRSTSARACATRCRRWQGRRRRFSAACGRRPGDAARLQRQRLHAGPALDRSGRARPGHRSHARVGRHGALRRHRRCARRARAAARAAIDAALQRRRRSVEPRRSRRPSRAPKAATRRST